MAAPWAIAFYNSKAWKRLRMALILERGAVCSHCHADMSTMPNLLIAHHTKELTEENILDPTIALNPELIDLICLDCHNKEHNRFSRDGIEKKVYIVWGPPCSGKTSMVLQSMERGDLIIDIDRIWWALSALSMYDKPNRIKQNVFGVHRELINQVKQRVGHWETAWIIGGFPYQSERERLVTELGAVLLYCERDKEECKSIARMERGVQSAAWVKYIDDWFAITGSKAPPG